MTISISLGQIGWLMYLVFHILFFGVLVRDLIVGTINKTNMEEWVWIFIAFSVLAAWFILAGYLAFANSSYIFARFYFG
jgi:hypothetical protein